MAVGSVDSGLVCHQLPEWTSNDCCLRSKSPVYEPKFACPVHCFLMGSVPLQPLRIFPVGQGFASGQSTGILLLFFPVGMFCYDVGHRDSYHLG